MVVPLLHIGYHKTGSSWLQRFVFGDERMPFATFSKRLDGPLKTMLVMPNPLDFDAEACREFFRPRLEEMSAAGKVPVVSSERLAGHPFAGGYDTKELAARLAAVFPEGRVLIVIREQRQVILSSYKQFVEAGGATSIEDYMHPPERAGERVRLFDFAHYAYDRTIRLYHGLFGADDVKVLAYEQLAADPRSFVAEIGDFAGADVPAAALDDLATDRPNLARGGASVLLERRLNQLFRRTDLNPAPLLARPALERPLRRSAAWSDGVFPAAVSEAVDRRLAAAVTAAVGDRYRDSNAATAQLTGLDLAGLGYAVR